MHPIGSHDHTTVPVSLLGIAVVLFEDKFLLPDQPGIVVKGTVIERRENQRSGDYLLALTIRNILFQRIPPYSLSILSQIRRGFPIT
jgi:hypothetical protein